MITNDERATVRAACGQVVSLGRVRRRLCSAHSSSTRALPSAAAAMSAALAALLSARGNPGLALMIGDLAAASRRNGHAVENPPGVARLTDQFTTAGSAQVRPGAANKVALCVDVMPTTAVPQRCRSQRHWHAAQLPTNSSALLARVVMSRCCQVDSHAARWSARATRRSSS